MASEWITTTIGEQATLQRGFDITKAEQRPGTIPVISSGGISSYHDTSAAKGPGVILGRKGVVGSVYYVDSDYWPHDTSLWVKDFHGNHRRFVFYFLKWLAPRIATMDVGSANPTLNRNHVHPIEIRWPPLPQQRAIACILGSLDDKIELNRRMNQTLEAMARAIFQSWFVNFDPVHQNIARAASARRRVSPRKTRSNPRTAVHGSPDPQHGYPPDIAALFPDAFEDSELGEIPKGWKVGAIAELAEVLGGSTPSTKRPEYWEGGVHHWATPKDLSGLSVPVLLDTERRITDAGLAEIGSGLHPIGSVLLSSRAPIGYLAINDMPVAVNQGFIAMRPRAGVPAQFLLRWAAASHDAIVSRANGSTFLEISKTNFRPIQIVVPSNAILEAFNDICTPLYRHVVSNERESRTLAALRDALLPKLISGELRVPDAERIAGRAL